MKDKIKFQKMTTPKSKKFKKNKKLQHLFSN